MVGGHWPDAADPGSGRLSAGPPCCLPGSCAPLASNPQAALHLRAGGPQISGPCARTKLLPVFLGPTPLSALSTSSVSHLTNPPGLGLCSMCLWNLPASPGPELSLPPGLVTSQAGHLPQVSWQHAPPSPAKPVYSCFPRPNPRACVPQGVKPCFPAFCLSPAPARLLWHLCAVQPTLFPFSRHLLCLPSDSKQVRASRPHQCTTTLERLCLALIGIICSHMCIQWMMFM